MKFICNACTKQGEPCILDVGNDNSVTLDSLRCVLTDDHCCKWKEFNGNQPPTNSSQSVTNCNRLPKLTVDVFNRPDCPQWAKYAAVNADGKVALFSDAPWRRDDMWVVTYHSTPVQADLLGDATFDSTDWQNSLIERPAKLQDWCKVGAIGFEDEYFKIIKINDKSCYVQYLDPHMQDEDGNIGGITFDCLRQCHEARLRPYNAEEIPDLPFEVTERNSNFRTTVVSCQGNNVWLGGALTAISTEELMRDFTAKGEPCGCLEHLENGEWVK